MRRVFTSIILAVLLFAGLFHSFFWLLFIAGFATGAAWEFTRIFFKERLHAVSGLVVSTATLFPLNAWLKHEGWFSVDPSILIALVLILAPTLFIMSRGTLEEFRQDVPMAVFGALWIGWLMSFLIPVYYIKVNGFLYGIQSIFFLAFTACGNDVGAYYTGSAFGKHKLSELYSPKKTWEGLIGGYVVALILGQVTRFFFADQFSALDAALMTLGVVIAGTFGDLVESVFKRSFAVKDAGDILPGHGGILDRVDSILFAAPVLYWYLHYVIGR